MFEPGTAACVKQLKVAGFSEDDEHGWDDWKLLEPLNYVRHNRSKVTAPEGISTDFASVPRPFVWLIPRYGHYSRPAVLHDALCRDIRSGSPSSQVNTRREADLIFRQAMQDEEIAFFRRWMVWAAVRVGATSERFRASEVWKDALPIACLLLVAAPIVGPPSIVIGAALVVFFVLEMITLPILKIARFLGGQKSGASGIEAPNRPRLSFKT